MHVLVPGGTGFLGTSTVKALCAHGHTVTVLSRGKAAVPIKGAVYIVCDLLTVPEIEAARKQILKVDALVHLAARMPRSPQDPGSMLEHVRDNVIPLVNVLDVFGQDISHVLYASSADVYGPVQMELYTEDQAPMPQTYYAATKYMGEIIAQTYARRNVVLCSILRLSQVYGPGDAVIKVIPRFIEAVKNGEPVRLVARGADKRRYLYIDDAAEAIVFAINKQADGVFNIAGEEITEIKSLVALMQELCGKHVDVRDVEGEASGDKIMSIERMKKVLGFEPHTTMRDGLTACLKAARII